MSNYAAVKQQRSDSCMLLPNIL